MTNAMEESDLPPEPCEGYPGPGTAEQIGRWTIWCAKAAAIRFSGLRDSVEIWSFHMAVEHLLERDYDEAIAFILEAFPPDSAARAAALRPAPKMD
jgi:hypothetical protein